MRLSDYRTLVFDCDGVILDSNRIKTEAFRLAAIPYGAHAADALVKHHVQNGGISRYKKFEYFLRHIVPASVQGPLLHELLEAYAQEVRKGLLSCAIAPGLRELREKTAGTRWLVASGGDQQELREVFAARDLSGMFDGGIFGSPDDKSDIVAREMSTGNIARPALFLGDSRYDHQVSLENNLDFVFLSRWSEFSGWQEHCSKHNLIIVDGLDALK
ncbi:HAD family hydrolase [Pseudomonas sp. Irchel 3E20]|uniref:HAD family hydrolase n=1 Tax=Pseudomonas sp. Irchel 3E20 TaxID=2008983 RepID=UPI000BA3A945|nr:HAD family hydrolase [Pseudomonas sp. Irchel 3E20]